MLNKQQRIKCMYYHIMTDILPGTAPGYMNFLHRYDCSVIDIDGDELVYIQSLSSDIISWFMI